MPDMRAIIILAAGACLAAPAAWAQDGAQEDGRYRLEKTDSGYVRLDSRTGAISVCAGRDGQLICKMAADDRQAYESDLSALQDKVRKLEDRVSALEKTGAPQATGLPSDAEFEKSMNYMERFLRRFMGIAKSFEDEQDQPAPGRT